MKWAITKAQLKVKITSIVDPFAGSGTTCFAAQQMNIQNVGIEKIEKYLEAAAKRCSQEVLDLGI
jgi:DNA modification methylase